MRNNVLSGGAYPPAVPFGWTLSVADFDLDGHPDYLLLNSNTRQSVIWYLSGVTRTSIRSGPTIPAGLEVAGLADFDCNGTPDYLLYNSSTHQTAIWYLNNYQFIGSAAGPTLPSGWSLVAP